MEEEGWELWVRGEGIENQEKIVKEKKEEEKKEKRREEENYRHGKTLARPSPCSLSCGAKTMNSLLFVALSYDETLGSVLGLVQEASAGMDSWSGCMIVACVDCLHRALPREGLNMQMKYASLQRACVPDHWQTSCHFALPRLLMEIAVSLFRSQSIPFGQLKHRPLQCLLRQRHGFLCCSMCCLKYPNRAVLYKSPVHAVALGHQPLVYRLAACVCMKSDMSQELS